MRCAGFAGSGAGDAAVTADGARLRIHAVVDPGWRNRARDVLGGGRDEGARGDGTIELGGREVPYRLVESDDAAAAVTPAGAADGEEALVLHARTVEALLGLRSVVPVPGELVARDEDAVRRFLGRARVPLREALDRFEGCYEMRLHVARRGDRGPEPRDGETDAGGGSGEAAASAEGLYRQLRFRARSARRMAAAGGRILTGAFLVSREDWIGFVEEASRLEDRRPEVEIDVTGPWAPYDFVRFLPEGPP